MVSPCKCSLPNINPTTLQTLLHFRRTTKLSNGEGSFYLLSLSFWKLLPSKPISLSVEILKYEKATACLLIIHSFASCLGFLCFGIEPGWEGQAQSRSFQPPAGQKPAGRISFIPPRKTRTKIQFRAECRVKKSFNWRDDAFTPVHDWEGLLSWLAENNGVMRMLMIVGKQVVSHD